MQPPRMLALLIVIACEFNARICIQQCRECYFTTRASQMFSLRDGVGSICQGQLLLAIVNYCARSDLTIWNLWIPSLWSFCKLSAIYFEPNFTMSQNISYKNHNKQLLALKKSVKRLSEFFTQWDCLIVCQKRKLFQLLAMTQKLVCWTSSPDAHKGKNLFPSTKAFCSKVSCGSRAHTYAPTHKNTSMKEANISDSKHEMSTFGAIKNNIKQPQSAFQYFLDCSIIRDERFGRSTFLLWGLHGEYKKSMNRDILS